MIRQKNHLATVLAVTLALIFGLGLVAVIWTLLF